MNALDHGCEDYSTIAKDINMPRQTVRKLCLRYKETGEIFEKPKGRPRKLDSTQMQFLDNLISDPKNISMTLMDMRAALLENFKFKNNKLSITTVFRAFKRNKNVFKKIVWKKPKDNESRTKNLRKAAAIDILKAHLSSLSPVYIDETSFNLMIRPLYSWGFRGKIIFGIRPAKSTNYSLLAAMDNNGIIGWMLFRGGVKKEDFFAFLMEMIKDNSLSRWQNTNSLFFMDNAKIHKSRDFMQKIVQRYYSILYNAPYSPQLNPIEYCFSQIKAHVRKANVKSEKELIQAISSSIQQVTAKDCINYVIETFKFLRIAYDKQDFI